MSPGHVSQALHNAIFDSSSDAIVSIDREGLVTSWNHGAGRMFGYSREEILGKAYDVIVPPEDLETFRSNFQAIREGSGHVDARETIRVAKDGRRVTVSLSAFPVIGGGASVSGAIMRDLTAQRRAEGALRETQQRLQAVLDNSPNMIYLKDPEGRFLQVNRQLRQHMDRTEDEIIGKTVFEMYPPETAEKFAEDDRLVLATGAPVEREIKVEFRAGARVVISNKFPLVDPDGNVQLICGISTDVTDRKQAEDDLRELQWQLQGIMENSFTSIHVKDLEGHYLLVNQQQEKLLGHPASEILGRTAYDLLPPETAASLTEREREVIESGPSLTQEVTLPFPSGDRVVLSNKFPLRGRDGTVRYVGGIALDITDRKRMERALASATAAAEVANRAKSEFLSRMSHELRTPLNVVLGFAQVLQLNELRPEQDEAVTHILVAGRHLLDLIDEVLDISRIEAGRLALSIELLNAQEIVDDVVTLMQPLARDQGISVEVAATEGDCYVMADRQRLKQVLLNLLSNAIKYNRENGLVTVRCMRGDAGYTRILVTDTGYGIASNQLVHLFQPFERLGAEATGVQGTGLGLALSNQLVAAMQGTIGMESVLDVGSTFWVQLPTPGETQLAGGGPAEVTETALPVDERTKVGTSLYTVLLIEDTLSNLNLVERLLSRWPGVTLIPAMQGRLGLELARQYHPDLVLLDLHLPDLSGERVLSELKADPATRDISVIVVSADATAGQVERLKAAGAIEYLTKPLDVRQFLSVVSDVLGRVQQDPPPTRS